MWEVLADISRSVSVCVSMEWERERIEMWKLMFLSLRDVTSLQRNKTSTVLVTGYAASANWKLVPPYLEGKWVALYRFPIHTWYTRYGPVLRLWALSLQKNPQQSTSAQGNNMAFSLLQTNNCFNQCHLNNFQYQLISNLLILVQLIQLNNMLNKIYNNSLDFWQFN